MAARIPQNTTDLGDVSPTAPTTTGQVPVWNNSTLRYEPGTVSGGGGNTISAGAYASRPAAATAGNLYLATDALVLSEDTGSAWRLFGPLSLLTDPTTPSWTDLNSPTVTTNGPSYYISSAANAAANLRGRYVTAPSTPYTITMHFVPAIMPVNYSSCGVFFRESSSGKLHVFGFFGNTNGGVTSEKWTNATTFSAGYTSVTGLTLPPRALRIADDGTNRICSVSWDGLNWTQFHSIGRTDFLTADQIGFGVNSQNATWGAAMTVLSWA